LARKETIKKMAEKQIGRKTNWLKKKVARKKLAKTLAWHTCLAVCKNIQKKISK
jgi:hypothetical protein